MVSDGSDTSLSEAVATLRKQRWILILATVLGISYGSYKAFTQPKLYAASSTIQVHNVSYHAFKVDASSDYSDDSQTKMNTEVFILKSDTLLENVATNLDLANNPAFSPVSPGQRRSMAEPRVRADTIGALRGGLQVGLIPRTELISISFASPSAKLAADIVNGVVGAYIDRSFKAPKAHTELVTNWISDHGLESLKVDVDRSQQQMMELQRQLGVLGYDSNHNQLQSSLENLLSAEGTAKIARIMAESRYRLVTDMHPDPFAGTIHTTPGTAPSQLNSLRAQIAMARSTYAQLTAPGGLGPNHPKVKALQDQMAELTKEINAEQSRLELQAREHYLAAKAIEDKTEQELDARKAEAYKQGDEPMVRLSSRCSANMNRIERCMTG